MVTEMIKEINALEILKSYRKRKGLSVERLASEIGVHSQTLLKLFSGETREMSPTTKQKIADFLARLI